MFSLLICVVLSKDCVIYSSSDPAYITDHLYAETSATPSTSTPPVYITDHCYTASSATPSTSSSIQSFSPSMYFSFVTLIFNLLVEFTLGSLNSKGSFLSMMIIDTMLRVTVN